MNLSIDPATGKIVLRINASALKSGACKLHFWNTAVEGYRQKYTYNDTEFGSAIHLFIRTMYETGGNIGVAMHTAKKYYETTKFIIRDKKKYLDTQHLMGVCVKTWEWIQGNLHVEPLQMEDGKPAIELTFSNKYYEDDEFIVYLEGTIDFIGRVKGGCNTILDWKSTSSWSHEEYLSGYGLAVPLRFYVFNFKLFGSIHPDTLIGKLSRLPLSAVIIGIFLNGKEKTVFERSEYFQFKEADMVEFDMLLGKYVSTILEYLRHKLVPPAEGKINGACTTMYGKCKYFGLCATPDKVTAGHILRNNFIQEVYEPLKRDKHDNEN